MNTASAMFSASRERQLYPNADIQNCSLTGPGTVHLEVSENLKFWNPKNLSSSVGAQFFRFSGFQFPARTDAPKFCPTRRPLRPGADAERWT